MKRKAWRSALAALAVVVAAVVAIAPQPAWAKDVSTEGDLKAALAEGGEVTLTSDVTLSDGVMALGAGKDIVLDLGGYTLTLSGVSNYLDDTSFENTTYTKVALINEGSLSIDNGTVVVSSASDGIVNTDSATLTLGADVVLVSTDATFNNYALVRNFGGTVSTAATMDCGANNAIITFGGTVDITGGTISAPYHEGQSTGSVLLIFNRAYSNTSSGANVTISGGDLSSGGYVASTNNTASGGTSGSNLTITGGTLAADAESAIYWPSSGTLTIGAEGAAGGPTITSKQGSGIEICSGTLNVFGGTINGGTDHIEDDSVPTSEALVKAFRDNPGSSSMGDAITVIARRSGGYVDSGLTVNIEGGTFTSAQNYGLRFLDCNVAVGADTLEQIVSVEVSDGSFSGKIASVDATYTADEGKGFVSGGSFSEPVPGEYIAGNAVNLKDNADENAPFSVVPKSEAASKSVATVTVDGQVVYFVSASDAQEFAKESGGAEVHVTTCRVTFDPGYEGGEPFYRYVTKNSSVARPADPERAGYEFAGWVTEGGGAYRFGSAVTRSLTLTATWELAEPDVTVSVSDDAPIQGDAVTIAATVVEVEGVEYSYQWYVDGEPIGGATGSSITVTADGSYSVRVTATDADGLTAELATDPVEVAFGGVVMHRLYNPYTGEHLYTSDVAERDALVGVGWSYEGVAWVAPAEGAPVWRLYNACAPGGDHHYTTDKNEYEELQRLGWRGEGVAWYSAGAEDEGAVALYRLYNPYATTGTHHYTADLVERDTLARLGWRHEGVAWYGIK